MKVNMLCYQPEALKQPTPHKSSDFNMIANYVQLSVGIIISFHWNPDVAGRDFSSAIHQLKHCKKQIDGADAFCIKTWLLCESIC